MSPKGDKEVFTFCKDSELKKKVKECKVLSSSFINPFTKFQTNSAHH